MIRNHSHLSLLQAYGTPEQIVDRAVELEFNYCGLTDIESVSGCIDFYSRCKKKGIKPILGCDFIDYTLICKNKDGWRELMGILSKEKEDIPQYSPNLILLNHTIEPIDSWEKRENCFRVLSDNILCKNAIVCKPSYYIKPEDKELHHILLAGSVKKSIPEILENPSEPDVSAIIKYFSENADYSMSSEQDSRIEEIVSQVEEFEILSDPKLPHFNTPEGKSEVDYLRDLARGGWKSKIRKLSSEDREIYRKRVEKELEVINKANLAGYFLIVQDFIEYARSIGALTSWGRGSAAGSMIAYLVGITGVDPIEFGLIFERFFNPSRSYPKHVDFEEFKFIDDFRDKD